MFATIFSENYYHYLMQKCLCSRTLWLLLLIFCGTFPLLAAHRKKSSPANNISISKSKKLAPANTKSHQLANYNSGKRFHANTFTLKRGSIMQICRHFQTQKCVSVSKNNEIIVKFVINYHPSAIKLSISASGQRQSRSVWIET